MDLMTNLMPAGAEIFLLVMACVILIADLLIKQSGRQATYMLAQLTLLGCSLITVGAHEHGVVYAFHNMYVDDLMADGLKLLTYLAVSMMLVYSRQYLTVRGLFSGEFMVLALFAIYGWRGLRAALAAPDDFGRLAALGITAMVVSQALINLAVVLGMMPTKGIPLPFISYGGSSLLVMLLATGVLLNISQQAD